MATKDALIISLAEADAVVATTDSKKTSKANSSGRIIEGSVNWLWTLSSS
jgi:hypothetical protein